MNLSAYTYRIQTLLQEAKNVLIVVKKDPDIDVVAASLSLYLSLTQRGKQVSVICPDKMTVSFSDLFAVDKISDELGKKGKNLVLSFPYIEGSIEKVSYNIENNRFNLVIEPRGEEEGLLNKDSVEFSRSGEGADSFDLVFALGVSSYLGLGKLQASSQKLFAEKPVVVIDTNQTEAAQFGTVSVVSPANTSISEIVTLLLSRLNLPIDRDIAKNLLKGLKEKTQNFTQNAQADTFEAAAIAMRKSSAAPSQLTPRQNPYVDNKKAPPDWLKPKIFRSSNINPSDTNKGTIL